MDNMYVFNDVRIVLTLSIILLVVKFRKRRATPKVSNS